MTTAYPKISLMLPGRWERGPLSADLRVELDRLVDTMTSDLPSRWEAHAIVQRVAAENPDHVWIQVGADEVTLILLSWAEGSAAPDADQGVPDQGHCVAHAELLTSSPDGSWTAIFDVVTVAREKPTPIDEALFRDIVANIRWDP